MFKYFNYRSVLNKLFLLKPQRIDFQVNDFFAMSHFRLPFFLLPFQRPTKYALAIIK